MLNINNSRLSFSCEHFASIIMLRLVGKKSNSSSQKQSIVEQEAVVSSVASSLSINACFEVQICNERILRAVTLGSLDASSLYSYCSLPTSHLRSLNVLLNAFRSDGVLNICRILVDVRSFR